MPLVFGHPSLEVEFQDESSRSPRFVPFDFLIKHRWSRVCVLRVIDSLDPSAIETVLIGRRRRRRSGGRRPADRRR